MPLKDRLRLENKKVADPIAALLMVDTIVMARKKMSTTTNNTDQSDRVTGDASLTPSAGPKTWENRIPNTMKRLLATAILAGLMPINAQAESMGWVQQDQLEPAMAPFLENWMEPNQLAVRINQGWAEFNIEWVPDTAPFSFNVYAVDSRAEADELIQFHAEAENLLGGPSKLCLHKFARAQDGANDYYLLYLVDDEQSGLRCIKLPKP